MDVIHAINVVENSKEFKDFSKKNPHYYLVHVFTVKDSEHDGVWQIGYYSKDTDKLVVFENNDDLILVHPPAEALKKDEYIQHLDKSALQVPKTDAVQLCDEVLAEYYPREVFSKALFLLQNLPEFGQVWNITLVTQAFSIINIKIDAGTGKVVKHHKENLMNWKAN
jgi:hypothetical protein